jgi:hypothetical protein
MGLEGRGKVDKTGDIRKARKMSNNSVIHYMHRTYIEWADAFQIIL